jgi:hypothetical protein
LIGGFIEGLPVAAPVVVLLVVVPPAPPGVGDPVGGVPYVNACPAPFTTTQKELVRHDTDEKAPLLSSGIHALQVPLSNTDAAPSNRAAAMQKEDDTQDTEPASNVPRSGARGISLGGLQAEPL